MTMRAILLGLLLSWTCVTAQSPLADRLHGALVRAGVPVTSVSVFDEADRSTWTVTPATLQRAAQPIINSFTPDDPEVVSAELDRDARQVPRHVKALVLYYLRDKLQRNPTQGERQAALEALIQAYKDVGP